MYLLIMKDLSFIKKKKERKKEKKYSPVVKLIWKNLISDPKKYNTMNKKNFMIFDPSFHRYSII